MLIKNGRVFIAGKYHDNLAIRFHGDRITEIGVDLTDTEIIDAEGNLVFPGFIDTHNHGGYGLSFAGGYQAVREICRQLPQAGVTAVLPTLGPASIEEGINAVRAIRQVRKESGIAVPFGLHYEGPYFSLERHASWNPKIQRNPSKEFTLAVADHDLSDVVLINTAPELPGALDWIEWVVTHGVKVELCYTQASSDLIKEAADRGATQISHLFNGFEAMHHRINGPIVGCLLEDRLNAQLTCDGIHVAAAWIKLAIKIKGVDRIYGITDSSEFTGMAEGEFYNTDNEKFIIQKDRVLDTSGVLTSGCAPWDVIMRSAKNKIGLSLEEIGSIYGESPAKCLGINDRGKIEIDRKADFTIMDAELNVVKTIIAGKVCFQQ